MASENSAARRVRGRHDSDGASPDVAAGDGEVADPRSAGMQEAERRRVRRRLDSSPAACDRAQVGAPQAPAGGDHAARDRAQVGAPGGDHAARGSDGIFVEVEEDSSSSAPKRDLLSQLPTDLLLLIMDKTETCDLIKCATTCKSILKMVISEEFRMQFRKLRNRSEYIGMHSNKGEFFYQRMQSSIPRALSLDFLYNLTGQQDFSIDDSEDGKLLCHLSRGQQMSWYVTDPLHQTYVHLGRSPQTGQYFLQGIYLTTEVLDFFVLLVFLEGGPNSTRVKLRRYSSGTQAWSSAWVQTGFQMPPAELLRQPNVRVGYKIYILEYSTRVIEINLSGRPMTTELKPPELPTEDRDCIHSIAKTAAKELSFVAVGFSRTVHVWAHKRGGWEKVSNWAPQIIRFSSRLSILGCGTRSNTILLQGYYSDGTHKVILLDAEDKKEIPISQDRVCLLQPSVYELECPPMYGMRKQQLLLW